MYIDKASFFLALGTLAVGGAAGYAVSDRRLFATTSERTPPATGAAASATVAGLTAPQAPAAPACDDMTGAPADCPPPPYSADESGCAPIATKRCEEFKQAMKPRVAERAVACVLALNPAQRCDASRVNLCGHVALMNACGPEQSVPTGTAPGEDLGARCQAIAQSCPSAGAHDCEATLSGMTAIGRERMARCMSAHCADKGLVGCEALGDAK
jgi:hypothetical protein